MTAVHDMKYRQGGFTLVEMMVAMLLGIMILLAVSEVFVNNNRTRVEIENTTRQIENGRYAMQLLESELANAGFWGEASTMDFPATLPPACVNSPTEVEDSMGVPVFGEGVVASGAEPSCFDRFKAGNDYLAVRRSSTCAVGSAGCDPFLADAYHFRVSACQSNNPGAITLAKSEAGLAAVTARNCTGPAPTYKYLNRLYYVREDDVLVRAELMDPDGGNEGYMVTPLVDGIERLHFGYGLDDNGDGEVNTFVRASDVDDWSEVVAVRVWLLARNLESSQGYVDSRTYILGLGDDEDEYEPVDGFKRQLYTSTIRLNNVAGRLESPVAASAAGAGEDSPVDGESSETTTDQANGG